MGKNYQSQLSPSLRGFIVDDCIIFYQSKKDEIDVVRVVNGYRDLASIFSDSDQDRAIAFSEVIAGDVAILLERRKERAKLTPIELPDFLEKSRS